MGWECDLCADGTMATWWVYVDYETEHHVCDGHLAEACNQYPTGGSFERVSR